MFGGFSGIGKFLGLIASLVRRVLAARKTRAAQETYDRIEDDPAGAFIDRFSGRVSDGGDKSADPSAQADPGEREKK